MIHEHHVKDDLGRWHCFRHRMVFNPRNGGRYEADFRYLIGCHEPTAVDRRGRVVTRDDARASRSGSERGTQSGKG